MTQATDILTRPRASEGKLVAGVCFAHLVSHYYIVLLAPQSYYKVPHLEDRLFVPAGERR